MALSSSKKPFMRPVQRGGPWGSRGYALGIIDFYRTPAYHMKEIVSKFSEFEKPYDGGGPRELQAPIAPRPGELVPPELPPFLPPLLPSPLPPPPIHWSPPTPELDPRLIAGCDFIEGLGGTFLPGDFSTIVVWAKAFPQANGGVVYGEAIVGYEVDGPLFVSLNTPGFWVGGTAQINEDAEEDELLIIKATTASGASCQAAGAVGGQTPLATCAADATISYTSLDMGTGEEQTLESSDGESKYTWTSTEGGELDSGSGQSVTYSSAASNDETCASNGEINMLCDGEIVDTIVIAANDVESAEVAVLHANASISCIGGTDFCCTEACEEQENECKDCCCAQQYDCDGASLGPLGTCSGACLGEPPGPPCGGKEHTCLASDWQDKRGDNGIEGGCCPSQLRLT